MVLHTINTTFNEEGRIRERWGERGRGGGGGGRREEDLKNMWGKLHPFPSTLSHDRCVNITGKIFFVITST